MSFTCLGFALLFAPSGSQGEALLQPREICSPSGRVRLLVDPGQRGGGGQATYRCRRDEVLLWQGTRPYTLWDAVATEDGTIAGYAYAAGLSGGSGPAASEGDRFLVVVLASDGTTRMERSQLRRFSENAPFDSWVSVPTARGCFLDGRDFVVRVAGTSFEEESWWSFSLATGEELGRRSPAKEELKKADEYGTTPAAPLRAAADPIRGRRTLERVGTIVLELPSGETSPPSARGALLAVAPDGRLLRVERATGKLHTFTQGGVRLATSELQSAPGTRGGDPALSVTKTGDVLFGRRLLANEGAASELLPCSADELRAQARTDRFLGLEPHAIVLLERDGTLDRRIERTPENRWLPYLTDLAVAPDGSFAVQTFIEHPRAWFVYAASGAPARTVLAPTGGHGGAFAFDGRQLVALQSFEGVTHLIRIDLLTDARVELVGAEALSPTVTPLFPPATDDLWLFDGDARIVRYARP